MVNRNPPAGSLSMHLQEYSSKSPSLDQLSFQARAPTMEINRKLNVLYLCPFCGSVRRRLPVAGMLSDRFGLERPIGLCTSCGPLNLDLLELCRESVVGSWKN